MLSKKDYQLLDEKLPSKGKIISTAKAVRVKKDAFEQSNPYELWITPFMQDLVKITIAIFKKQTAHFYLAIEKLNGEIRQIQDVFELAAIVETNIMHNVEGRKLIQGNCIDINLLSVYHNADSRYKKHRVEAKKTRNEKISEAELIKKQIESYADTLTANCEAAIALFWKVARDKHWSKRIPGTPPTVYQLMDIAHVYITPVEIDRTEVADTAEYLRLMNNRYISPFPQLNSNVSSTDYFQMMVAVNNEEPKNEGGDEQ
jgi:hypothetical protein